VTIAANGVYPASFDNCGALPLFRVLRYFQIVPTTSDTATVRFWFRDSDERNGRTLASLKLWKCSNGGSWTQVGSSYQTSGAPDASGYDYFQASGVPLGSAFVISEQGPTAVTVRSFHARRQVKPAGVSLTWRSVSELDLAGFNVWRRTAGSTRWTKLNARLIVARGGGTAGRSYSYLDRKALAGHTYAYRLEAVALEGDRHWVGAISFKVGSRR
jgi:hypothetical protein